MVDELDGLEVRHLRYFLTVARAGKISTASQELKIAQPSLSQLIQRLEGRLGITLFARTARGMRLTPAGEVFRQGVERIMDELATALEEAGSTTRVVRAGVCVGVVPALITDIEDAVRRCQRKPISIRFRSESSTRQLELLRSGELDFAIVRLPLDANDLEIATVDDQELGVVAHIGHPLADRQQVRWADLVDQRLLWFDARRAPGYAHGLLAELGEHGWRPTPHVADSDRHSLFAHALRSAPDLVALRPRSTVSGDAALVWIPIVDDAAPRERLGLAALRDGVYGATVRAIEAAGGVTGRTDQTGR